MIKIGIFLIIVWIGIIVVASSVNVKDSGDSQAKVLSQYKPIIPGNVIHTVKGKKILEFTSEPIIAPVTEDELTELTKGKTFISRRLTLEGEPLSHISTRVDFDTPLEYEEEIPLKPGLLEPELPSFDLGFEFGDADTGLTWSSDGVLETTSVIVRGEEILVCLFMGIDLIGCRKTTRYEEGIKILFETEGNLKKMLEIVEGIKHYE